MDEKRIPGHKDTSAKYHAEDRVLKAAAQFFAEEFLPYFGIEGKVIAIAPKELVHVEVKQFYEDFNFVMEDGSWNHFEFQSKDGSLDGLKRFRVYEALASYQYKVAVSTYVIYSGEVKNPMTEFTEGGNTYRIHPIILKGEDADIVIAELQDKIIRGETITKKDLFPLSICLLMGGKMSLKDRAKAAYGITRAAVSENPEEIQKVEALLYIMAEKFLDKVSMDELMEAMKMTRFGEMMIKEGRAEGEIAGEEKTKLKNARNLIGLLDEHVIAEKIELPLETVLKLKEEINAKKGEEQSE